MDGLRPITILLFGLLGAIPALTGAIITNICQGIVPGAWTTTPTFTSDQPDFNLVNNTATFVDHVLPLTSDLAVSIAALPSGPLVVCATSSR